MGDRRNIVVEFSADNSVALYSHWDGSELVEVLREALKDGRVRWTDPSYLTRVIFSRMVKDDVLGTTGYGIEPFRTGEGNYCEASLGYDIFVLVKDQMVCLPEGSFSFEDSSRSLDRVCVSGIYLEHGHRKE